jgi:hypothetical protein
MLYRVYFNRSADFPLIWSFDEGDTSTEVLVTDFVIDKCVVTSAYDPNGDNINTPKGYLRVDAEFMLIEDDIVYFY